MTCLFGQRGGPGHSGTLCTTCPGLVVNGLPARGIRQMGSRRSPRDCVCSHPKQQPAAKPWGVHTQWPGSASLRGAVGARTNGGQLWGRCCPRAAMGEGPVSYARMWSHTISWALVPITDGKELTQGCLGWESASRSPPPMGLYGPSGVVSAEGMAQETQPGADRGAPFFATALLGPAGGREQVSPDLPCLGTWMLPLLPGAPVPSPLGTHFLKALVISPSGKRMGTPEGPHF